MAKKLSLTYRFLRAIGLNYSEEAYGQVSLWDVIKRVLKTYRDGFLVKFIKESWILSPILPRKLRPWIFKVIGCKVGKNVFIGDHVQLDSGHAEHLIIEDHVHIAQPTQEQAGNEDGCQDNDTSHRGDAYLLHTEGVDAGVALRLGNLLTLEQIDKIFTKHGGHQQGNENGQQ